MSHIPVYKFFCDESCHLEHDGADIMVLGAIHCSDQRAEQVTRHIKWLRHKYSYKTELKWTKLIKKQWPFYKELLDYFLDSDDINFKATVVLNKHLLNHQQYNSGSHNSFYYKMFYYTLRDFFKTGNEYRIYLDYMDTLGSEKTRKLCEVLKSGSNFGLLVSTTIIQSYESQIIQLCDLLIGAIAYKNREDITHSSEIKTKLINYLEQKLCHQLDYATPQWEEKFNIFRFSPRGGSC